MGKDSTQLRYVKSKDLDTIVEWVNLLPYKVEVKGSAFFANGKFYLTYVSPNSLRTEPISEDLDG